MTERDLTLANMQATLDLTTGTSKPLLNWFNQPIEVKPKPNSPNPCVTAYGPGPEDKQCKDCAHMVPKHYDKTYWKCDLRNNTNGSGSDHRRRWPTCAKFEQVGRTA